MPQRAVLFDLGGDLLDPTGVAAANYDVSDLASAYNALGALVGGPLV